jgi:hypothetical protein
MAISCSTLGCSNGIGAGTIAGEVNGLSGTTFSVSVNANVAAVVDPVLIIIGVPNPPAGFTPPNITAVNGVGVTPFGPGLNGGAWGWNGSSGATSFTSGNQDAYAALGLGSAKTGQASESFGNWQTANAQAGLGTTSFSLYVYAVSGLGLGGGNHTSGSFTFGSPLPVGTFIIAYSCTTPNAPTAVCPQSGDQLGATPFTVAGEVNSVPEPTAFALLGTTGILGLIGGVRRKYRI